MNHAVGTRFKKSAWIGEQAFWIIATKGVFVTANIIACKRFIQGRIVGGGGIGKGNRLRTQEGIGCGTKSGIGPRNAYLLVVDQGIFTTGTVTYNHGDPMNARRFKCDPWIFAVIFITVALI